jgi:transcriptional regulator with AAA-type ATPase domain
MEILQSYHWPGNIRELQNFVERSARSLFASGPFVREGVKGELLT